MPEIKHNFTGGKMNKDVDQRLVPKGEYRDAMNIQVSTSEGSDVGTVQNILGNVEGCDYEFIPPSSSTVGSVADEKNDTLYWLVSGSYNGASSINSGGFSFASDMIVRKTPNKCEPVFVDEYAFKVANDTSVNIGTVSQLSGLPIEVYSEIQPGWTITGLTDNGDTSNTVEVLSIESSPDYTANLGVYTVNIAGNIVVPLESATGLMDANNNILYLANYNTNVTVSDLAGSTIDLFDPSHPDYQTNTVVSAQTVSFTIVNVQPFPQAPLFQSVSYIELTLQNATTPFTGSLSTTNTNSGVSLSTSNNGSIIWGSITLPTTPNPLTIPIPNNIINHTIPTTLTVGDSVLSTAYYGNGCIGSIINSTSFTLVNCSTGAPMSIPTNTFVFTIPGQAIIYLNANLDLSPAAPLHKSLIIEKARVLNFDHGDYITGINVIDDMLLWTDSKTEPKKISISRSIEGTQDFTFNANAFYYKHTRLMVEGVDKGPVKEKHITVIRKGPDKAPTISGVSSFRGGNIFGYITNGGMIFSNGTQPLPVGSVIWIVINDQSGGGMNFLPGDVLRFSSDSAELAPQYFEIRASVISVEDGPYSTNSGTVNASATQTAVKIEIESMSSEGLVTSINPSLTEWSVGLEEIGKTLFERKLPRFSTRYKYIDGEYSSIGPFTEVVFIPGDFRYHPSEAYNTGMVNKLRELTIQDFIPNNIPQDVVQVDILYKNEMSPNIYTVESVSRLDTTVNGENAWTATGSAPGLFGSYKVSSENIYATLPSNQTIRPWDNVPRKALAQEITGNRIVYANYTQNYNLKPSGSNEIIKPNIRTTISGRIDEDNSNRGKKSIKSMRTYDVGLVWGDKYGRETPIITPSSGSTKVPKSKSTRASIFNVEVGDTHPDWAEYYKLFIKETSNEYYNLAMDRLYDAEDGNVWISVPSIDRNKVDEDTYIILKKGIDTEDAIFEEARYKIVAIENEAPEYIKTRYNLLAESVDDAGAVVHSAELYGGENPSATGNSVGDAQLPSGGKNAPIPGVKGFSISIDRWTDEWYAGNDASNIPSNMGLPRLDKLFSDLKSGSEEMWVDFTRADDDDLSNPIHGNSGRYRITQLLLDDSDQDYDNSDFYEIKLHKPVTIEDGFITDDLNVGNDFVRARFWKKSIENLPQFDGRFFIKILRDSVVDDNLINYATTVRNWTITSSTQFHRLKDSSLDQVANTSFYQLYQPLSSYPTSYPSSGSAPPLNNASTTRTKAQWQQLLKFGGGSLEAKWFIDGASFASVMPNTSELLNQVSNKQQISTHRIATSDTTSSVDYTWWGSGPCSNSSYPTTENTGDGMSHGVLGMKGVHDSNGHHYFDFGYSVLGPQTSGSSTNFTVGEDDGNSPTNSTTDEEEQIVSRLTPNSRFKIEGDPTIYRIHSVTKRRLFNWRGYPTVPASEQAECTVPCPNYDPQCDCSESYEPCCECDGPYDVYWKWFTPSVYGAQFGEMHSNYNRRKTYRIRYQVDTLSLPNPDLTVTGNGWSETLPDNPAFTAVHASGVDAGSSINATIQFVAQFDSDLPNVISNNPAIFETEPKEDVDLDIYYEATSNIPTRINKNNRELFIPIGATLEVDPSIKDQFNEGIFVTGWDGTGGVVLSTNLTPNQIQLLEAFHPEVKFVKDDGGYLEVTVTGGLQATSGASSFYGLSFNPNNFGLIGLSWFNCWSFNNGVESNRIGDTYNKPHIGNGVKVSSVIDGDYEEEKRINGLIYSGIYNPNSNTNNLNQFISAEKITKDINPTYGSIQKLKSGWGQGGDLIALCEDRVLKILANKDALFNADGNSNVTSTNNVLGQAIPYSGEYGISKNPESFASEAYRVYFADKVRGTVMRLSMDGLTPISNHGMKDWFRDNLKLSDKLCGSYDDKKDEYNITIKGDTIASTVTFKEDVKGWVSFKSFIPENAISCANEYYTFKDGAAWKHHDEFVDRNTFYNESLVPSSVEVIFNEVPGSVKSFKTVNYEGSQAKVTSKDENNLTLMDGEYFNLVEEKGWHVTNVITNLEQGGITEFIKKEGKWFGYVTGNDVTISSVGNISGNYDTEDSSIQGIGRTSNTTTSIVYGCMDVTQFNYNSAATVSDGSCIAINSGCTNPDADNFQASANTDDGSCYWLGCTTGPLAVWSQEAAGGSMNFDSNATVDDGSCIPAIWGCTISGNFNYNFFANFGSGILSDGTYCGYANCMCIPIIGGCTDPAASNYITPVNELTDANTDDGSCEYLGCTDPIATNYSFTGSTVDSASGNYVYLNGTAVDDGTCTYIGGCMDADACNFDATATIDDGSCYLCGDNNADNYDAAMPFTDYTCLGDCTYCEDVTSVTITNQTTSDAGMSNGTVTIEWPESTSSSVTSYEVYGTGITGANITPSGNPTETHTITGLGAGTYTIYVMTLCLGGTGATLLAGLNLPGGNMGTGPNFGTPVSTTITSTPIPGCTDGTGAFNNAGGTWGACNFDASATVDDGSCEYTTCTGCNDSAYLEYCGDCWDVIDQVVVTSGGSPWVADTVPTSCLTFIVLGCMDATAFNYDPSATVDDGSCVAIVLGCTDDTLNNDGSYAASNYNALANTDDGSCNPYNCPVVTAVMNGNANFFIQVDVSATAYPLNNSGGFINNTYTSVNNGYTGTLNSSLNQWYGTPVGVYYGNLLANNLFTAGDTLLEVDVDLSFGTSQECPQTLQVQFTIGCTDSAANNAAGFDISDNTQCEYSGCMDATACNYNILATTSDANNPCLFCGDVSALNYDGATCTDGCVYGGCTDSTPSVMDPNAQAASNFDANVTVSCGANNDNECCTYHDDQDVVASLAGGTTFWMVQIAYEPGSTGYTEAVLADFVLGESPGTTLALTNQYPLSNMTSYLGDRIALMVIPAVWETYVYNNNLRITLNADFNGACDNDFLSDQLPTGNTGFRTFNFSVGCKDDNTAINYDPSVDLGMASTCIAANPGCTDPTATNYDAAFNQDCTATGSANPNDCCCYTCDEATFDATNPVVVNAWNDPNSPVYATQITFNFAVVSTAASYFILVDGGSTAIIPVVSPTINNGIVSYTAFTNIATFLNESTYNFKVSAICENNDGDSCGTSDSPEITITLND